MTLNSYKVYSLFVEYLIFKFGKEKILKIIKRLSKGKEIDLLFKKIYNKSFDELIKDRNK